MACSTAGSPSSTCPSAAAPWLTWLPSILPPRQPAAHAPVYLVASPLTRAQETAQPTAAALGLEIVTDPRIIEAENHFEGLRHEQGRAAQAQALAVLCEPLPPLLG